MRNNGHPTFFLGFSENDRTLTLGSVLKKLGGAHRRSSLETSCRRELHDSGSMYRQFYFLMRQMYESGECSVVH